MTFGPALDGAPTLFSVEFDLASVGYSVHEHFVSGTATAFRDLAPRTPDGRWKVEPAGTADFTTRIVVYRPTDPTHANGTLILEWLNVTGGLDVPALWMPTHRHLVRDGYTWVGVSAQRVSVDGGGMMPGLGLRQTAPERYDPLHHPGDPYAYDIFTQVARALPAMLLDRYGVGIDCVLAAGASQSAFHLTTYVNAIDAREAVFDGFLLGGRAGAGAPIEGWGPLETGNGPEADAARRTRLEGRDRIREDARVPVMVVQSETDVFGSLCYLPARQPDGPGFRLWEVAGAAHCDTYFLLAAARDSGRLAIEELASLIGRADRSGMPLERPMNSGPQMHFVLQRAFDALQQWVRSGTEPPSAPRLTVDDDRLAVDEWGVGRGGIRTPWVDAPAAVLSGLGQPGAMTSLFGTTRRLDDATLATRYPGGRAEYAAQFSDATRVAADAGFVLEVDVAEIDALGRLAWPAAGA